MMMLCRCSTFSINFSMFCLQREHVKLAAFWMYCINLVRLLLELVCSSRKNNFWMNLYTIRSLISQCFAYTMLNYAKYLPVYQTCVDMMNMADNDPSTFEYLQISGFSIKQLQHQIQLNSVKFNSNMVLLVYQTERHQVKQFHMISYML